MFRISLIFIVFPVFVLSDYCYERGSDCPEVDENPFWNQNDTISNETESENAACTADHENYVTNYKEHILAQIQALRDRVASGIKFSGMKITKMYYLVIIFIDNS